MPRLPLPISQRQWVWVLNEFLDGCISISLSFYRHDGNGTLRPSPFHLLYATFLFSDTTRKMEITPRLNCNWSWNWSLIWSLGFWRGTGIPLEVHPPVTWFCSPSFKLRSTVVSLSKLLSLFMLSLSLSPSHSFSSYSLSLSTILSLSSLWSLSLCKRPSLPLSLFLPLTLSLFTLLSVLSMVYAILCLFLSLCSLSYSLFLSLPLSFPQCPLVILPISHSMLSFSLPPISLICYTSAYIRVSVVLFSYKYFS